MDLIALKTEITTDPVALGYAGKTDEAIADLLNRQNRTPNRDSISGGMIAANVIKSEYAALSAADKAYFNMLIPAVDMPLTTTLKTELAALFPAGSATRTNLAAAVKRTGSRAEELGLGRVTPSDVADAKRS